MIAVKVGLSFTSDDGHLVVLGVQTQGGPNAVLKVIGSVSAPTFDFMTATDSNSGPRGTSPIYVPYAPRDPPRASRPQQIVAPDPASLAGNAGVVLRSLSTLGAYQPPVKIMDTKTTLQRLDQHISWSSAHTGYSV